MEACFAYEDPSIPQQVQLDIGWFTDRADAEALAPRFPKGRRARVVRCGTRDGDRFYVSFGGAIRLLANGVNDGRNETGIKRYRQIRRALDALGITIRYYGGYRNGYESVEAFDAAIQA